MANHEDLTGIELHENKGVAEASNNQVATASGGATVWKKLGTNNLDTSQFFGLNTYIFTLELADVSTASVEYLAFPFACTVDKIVTTLGAAITGADSTLTVRNNSGGSMGTITVTQSGSAAGDVDSLSPSSNNTINANQKLSFETDGGSTGTAKIRASILVTRTA